MARLLASTSAGSAPPSNGSSAHSTSFAAVFGDQAGLASPTDQRGAGGLTTPMGVARSGGKQARTDVTGRSAKDVVRCDEDGVSHSDATKNTCINVKGGDTVSLEALAAVYGGGLCPGALASPFMHKDCLKHCDSAGSAGHTEKGVAAHRLPSAHGPRN
jgi:hypothetical protein